MHQSADGVPVLQLDRDDESSAPHGDDGFLQISGRRGGFYYRVKLVPYGALLAHYPSSYVCERRACFIRHLRVREYCVTYLSLQSVVRIKVEEQMIPVKRLLLRRLIPVSESSRVLKGSCHMQQFSHEEHAAFLGSEGDRRYVILGRYSRIVSPLQDIHEAVGKVQLS